MEGHLQHKFKKKWNQKLEKFQLNKLERFMSKTRRTRLVRVTCVEDRRPVPDVHRGHGLLGAQQFTDDSRGHHTG